MTPTTTLPTGTAPQIVSPSGAEGKGRAMHDRDPTKGGDKTFGAMLADVAQTSESTKGSSTGGEGSSVSKSRDGRSGGTARIGGAPSLAISLAGTTDPAPSSGATNATTIAASPRQGALSLLAQLASTSATPEASNVTPVATSAGAAKSKTSLKQDETASEATTPHEPGEPAQSEVTSTVAAGSVLAALSTMMPAMQPSVSPQDRSSRSLLTASPHADDAPAAARAIAAAAPAAVAATVQAAETGAPDVATPASTPVTVALVEATSRPAPGRPIPSAVGQGADAPDAARAIAAASPAAAATTVQAAETSTPDVATPAPTPVTVALVEATSRPAPSRPIPSAVGQGADAASPTTTKDPDKTTTVVTGPSEVAPVPAADAPQAATAETAKRVEVPSSPVVPGGDVAAVVQSVAHAVTTLASEVAATPSSAPPTSTPSPTVAASTAAPPARSLTLQLSPADLGNVTVQLRLRGGALDVHLAVEDQKTLGLIAAARDGLASAIGAATTSPLGSLVIQAGAAPPPASAGSHDVAQTNRDAGHGAGTGAGAGNSGGSSAGGDGAMQRQSRGNAPASPREPRSAGGRGADGLFV